jgi:hypothetical protein
MLKPWRKRIADAALGSARFLDNVDSWLRYQKDGNPALKDNKSVPGRFLISWQRIRSLDPEICQQRDVLVVQYVAAKQTSRLVLVAVLPGGEAGKDRV